MSIEQVVADVAAVAGDVATVAKKPRKPKGVTIGFGLLALVAIAMYRKAKSAINAADVAAAVLAHPKCPKGAEISATAVKTRLEGAVPADFLEAVGKNPKLGVKFVDSTHKVQNVVKPCKVISPETLELIGRSVDYAEMSDLLSELEGIEADSTEETEADAGTES